MSARCRPQLQRHAIPTKKLNVNIVKMADERCVRANELQVLLPHSFQAKKLLSLLLHRAF
jgi:hypothetical protein